jgi:hypothetical protein
MMKSKLSAVARLVVLISVATAVGLAVPRGGEAASLIGGCPGYTFERPFAPWLDLANYVLMPNGGFEQGPAGWTLSGGAGIAAGNESFDVHGPGEATSLALPPGSSATTSAMCIGLTSTVLRLFVRNSGSLLSTLKVEVLYPNGLGGSTAAAVDTISAGSSWQPTLPIPLLVNLSRLPLLTSGTTSVAFRFTAQGSLGNWRIDDVYVDPFKGE